MTIDMAEAVMEGDGSPLHLRTQKILQCSLCDACLGVHYRPKNDYNISYGPRSQPGGSRKASW